MTTFKNIHFTKRYEFGTTIAFCQSETNPDPKNWKEVSEGELAKSGAIMLYRQADIAYFGWL